MKLIHPLQAKTRLRGAWADWLSLFLSGRCLLCDRAAPSSLCLGCQRQLQQSRLPLPLQQSHPLPLLAWGAYEGSLRQALSQLKYGPKPGLAEFLGTSLGQCWQAAPPALTACRPIVVPIPLHASKQQQRGFNQAELLARWFCRVTQLPLQPNGLVRVRATDAQHGLSAKARQQNLAAAFTVCPLWQQHRPSQPVLLLDDIYTTGATALAAAQTLRRYGISVVGIGAIARAIPSTAPVQSSRQVSKRLKTGADSSPVISS